MYPANLLYIELKTHHLHNHWFGVFPCENDIWICTMRKNPYTW